jgi:Cu/Ag efflux protein CusF
MEVPKTDKNQQDNGNSHVIIVPHIEDDVPLPKDSKDAMPEMSVADELNMRAKTIKEIADIKGENIEPSYSDVEDAEELAKEMMQNPDLKPEFDIYPNAMMAYLAGMVAQTNCMLTKQLADYKLYVLNNLVQIVHDTESNQKEKIAALRSIGEIDGVDAFKKKTEITHKHETMEEVETELLAMLSELKQKALVKGKSQTVDAEFTMSKKEPVSGREETKDN